MNSSQLETDSTFFFRSIQKILKRPSSPSLSSATESDVAWCLAVANVDKYSGGGYHKARIFRFSLTTNAGLPGQKF